MATVQRRLGVIVYADVVGYSRLIGSDELGTLTALKAHREAIDPLFAAEGGRLVKATDDSLLLEFPSAFHAVRATSSVQRLMTERNAAVPTDKRLVFRMGIHRGDVIAVHDDFSGVDIAARLRENAAPDGIRVSEATRTALPPNTDAMFRDADSLALSDIAPPVHSDNLALDVPDGVAPQPTTVTSAALLSFIVVPLVNSTGEARHDDFIDGVTDRLTNELVRIENSRAVPRATAMAYRRAGLDVTEIARELGVRFAIVGRARARTDTLDINIELFETATAQYLWSDRFDIALADPCEMQNAVVLRVVPPLRAQLIVAREHSPLVEPIFIAPRRSETISAEASTDAIPVVPQLAPVEAMPAASPVPPPATPSEPALVKPAQDDVAAGLAAPTPMFVAPTRDAAMAFGNARSTPLVVSGSASSEVAFRPAPGRPPPAPAPRLSPTRHVPFWLGLRIKFAIILAVELVALAILGAERNSIVEIVSCMLVAAGIVQLIAVIANGQRT